MPHPSDATGWNREQIAALATGAAFGAKEPARGARHAVSAHHPLSAHAGLQTLRAGGSAADAAVVMATVDTVVLPGTSTLGGTMTALFYEAATGRMHALNAGLNRVLARAGAAPYDHTADRDTGRAVLVPGVIAGLEALWRRFGALPWAALWRPAIDVAREGFPIYPFYRDTLERRRDVILRYPEGRAIFTPTGRLPNVGETFRQPRLAGTLGHIATEGAAYIYHGTWADRFVAAVRAAGGLMSREDLERYAVRWEEPLAGTYLGYELQATPPPHYGGAMLAFELNVAEALDLHRRPPRMASARTFFDEIQIWKAAMAIEALAVDPRAVTPDARAAMEDILSKQHGRRVAERIRASGTTETPQSRGTHSHHVVAVDAAGNMATATHTVQADAWGDSGLFIDGIAPNSTAYQLLTWCPEPGGRIAEPLSAYIVLHDGKPLLAAGAISLGAFAASLQTTIDVLAHGRSIAEAIAAPRWGHYEFDVRTLQFGEAIGVESGFAAALLDEVEALGQPLLRDGWADTGIWTAIGRDEDAGTWVAVADPRLTGLALAD